MLLKRRELMRQLKFKLIGKDIHQERNIAKGIVECIILITSRQAE